MRLVTEILKGNQEQVLALLEAGEDVNAIDQYGFTPLIEAAIVNHTEIARLLLAYHAEVNKPDVTGGTALYWAVNNNNEQLVELLLEHGADPNAYTKYAQPILVKPLLRRQQELIGRLLRAGANLKFAQDYINTKLLAHRYGLVGELLIANSKDTLIPIDLEGFVIEFTVNIIHHSLRGFTNHYSARPLHKYVRSLAKIINAFRTANRLLGYQHYLIDYRQYESVIDRLVIEPALILPVGYEGHAIAWVYYQGLLAKCDRKQDTHQGHSIVVYRITKPELWNPAFIKEMIYRKQNTYTMEHSIYEQLGLEPLFPLPMARQIAGNCSWANIEAAIPTLFFLLHYHSAQNEQTIECLWQEAMEVFQSWQQWDQWQALQSCIHQFTEAKSLARKASKALLLVAILFQKCRYDRAEHSQTIRKILAIFRQEQALLPILESYRKVYVEQFPSLAGYNFNEVLEIYG